MTTIDRFQITDAQAEQYESSFVPALFAQWAPWLVEAAGLQEGQTVLDVACGTGVVAREAADRGAGPVVGLDLNESMLAVARRIRPDIEWRRGDAAELPFADDSFDVVLCQAAMMFFPDPDRALREMARITVAGGSLVVQVFASLGDQPAYGPLVDVVGRYAGSDARELMGTYWRLGDLDDLHRQIAAAGLEISSSHTRVGTARFPSIDALVTTEVGSTPLIDRIDEATYEQIRAEAGRALMGYVEADGSAAVPIRGHVIAATKPRAARAGVATAASVVRSLMERYAAAVNGSDPTAYAELFTPDAIRVPAGSDPEYGPEQIAATEREDYELARWTVRMRLIDAMAIGDKWVHGLVHADAQLTYHEDGSQDEKHATKSFLLERQPSGAWLIKRYMWNLKS